VALATTANDRQATVANDKRQKRSNFTSEVIFTIFNNVVRMFMGLISDSCTASIISLLKYWLDVLFSKAFLRWLTSFNVILLGQTHFQNTLGYRDNNDYISVPTDLSDRSAVVKVMAHIQLRLCHTKARGAVRR